MTADEKTTKLESDYWNCFHALLLAHAERCDGNAHVTMTPPGRDADEIMFNWAGYVVIVFTLAHNGIKYLASSPKETQDFVEFGEFAKLRLVIKDALGRS
jgi:hypothetical protein